MNDTSRSLSDYIREIRGGLVCDRCRRYVGSLSNARYVPPPYRIAIERIEADDEASTLIGFEWHMLGLLRQGKFTLRHPQSKGRCVSIREWYAEQEESDDEDRARTES